ncbi:MAG TPA: hypothetical protein ENH82_15375 [bacterium]|nr:hypothetical protein [bacterium]
MKIGTKSLLFGVHQFALHPFLVLLAWLIIYKKMPRLSSLCAIITHDWGYWGLSNMDGKEGEAHPERSAKIWVWLLKYSDFRWRVCISIMGHSRFNAAKHNMNLSMLFRADKLSMALCPSWLYLLLGNLTGEIKEYIGHGSIKGDAGKYKDVPKVSSNQIQWLIETKAHMSLMGLHGENYGPVAKQLGIK